MQTDSLTVVCHACGEAGPADFAFCEACGKPLQGPQSAPIVDSSATADLRPESDSASGCVPVCLCGGKAFDALGYCEACGRRAAAPHATDIKALGDYAASASHRGLRHADNQDAVGMLMLPSGVAMVVADGVSTACHARAAADLACAEALATLRDFASVAPLERLALAVKRAHTAICKLPYDAAQMAEPQATVVLALIEAQHIWYAWVGDSRLYLIDATQAVQLTEDDSWLNEQLANGVDPQQALIDENAHCITQCLGMRDDEPIVHVGEQPLAEDCLVLLCSDGLWNYAQTPTALAQLVATNATTSLAQQCARMVDFANAAGGHDNITVALYSSRLADTAV